MRKITTLAAIFLGAMPGIAAAAEPPCLTTAEFSSLAGYSLPSVIGGTAKRCSIVLGPEAFLSTSGDDLELRYAEAKDAQWPGAKAAFLKLSATGKPEVNNIFRSMPDESLQEMVDALMEGMVSQQIPPEKCAMIDRVVRLMSPLPPANTVELLSLLVELGAKDKEPKLGKFRLCKSGT